MMNIAMKVLNRNSQNMWSRMKFWLWPYDAAGLIGLTCVLTVIMPVRISAAWLDAIDLDSALMETIKAWAFGWCLADWGYHAVLKGIENLLISQQKNMLTLRTWMHSVEYMIDWTTSLMVLAFMFSAFVQLYHGGRMEGSCMAWVLYAWVAFKTLGKIFWGLNRHFEKLLSQ